MKVLIVGAGMQGQVTHLEPGAQPGGHARSSSATTTRSARSFVAAQVGSGKATAAVPRRRRTPATVATGRRRDCELRRQRRHPRSSTRRS